MGYLFKFFLEYYYLKCKNKQTSVVFFTKFLYEWNPLRWSRMTDVRDIIFYDRPVVVDAFIKLQYRTRCSWCWWPFITFFTFHVPTDDIPSDYMFPAATKIRDFGFLAKSYLWWPWANQFLGQTSIIRRSIMAVI